ncbi:MAG: ABC transporter permease, partial [Vicinamibacterales bacterium]
MTFMRLVHRSLTHYWRTNVAVVLGVATAVSILAGALLVGHSVRESLADLVRQRLGATDLVVTSPTYVREQLAADLAAHPRFATAYRAAAPFIVATGVVTEQESGRRASGVRVYGVDDRFWRLNNVAPIGLDRRDAALSQALAREIGARAGAAVLVRVQRPSDVPLESLQGRKDDVGRTLRLTTHQVLSGAELGNFAIDAQQGDILAVFVSLERLREELEVGDRVNTILVSRAPEAPPESATLDAILDEVVRAEDIGFTIRPSDDGRAVIVGSSAGLVDDRQAAAIARLSPASERNGVFTYLANSIRVGSKEVPYSLVAGMDLPALAVAGGSSSAPSDQPPIVLNAWAANDLGAKTGDRLSMDYFVWEEPGRLATRSATFAVAGIVPTEAGGRDLAPEYPGISNTSSLQDWDPPFPIDLRRVRRVDEDYWTRYRTTPKAFVPLEVAQRLWTSRYGSLTSIRVPVAPGRVAADAAADVR